MNIVVNGKTVSIEDNITITELLKQMNVKMPDMVAVELNGDVVKRDKYAETELKEGDVVEFLYFMGGGYGIHRRAN